MKHKGVLTRHEIEQALETAETNALADATRVPRLSDANLDAVLFPIRFLRSANTAAAALGLSLSLSGKPSQSASPKSRSDTSLLTKLARHIPLRSGACG